MCTLPPAPVPSCGRHGEEQPARHQGMFYSSTGDFQPHSRGCKTFGLFLGHIMTRCSECNLPANYLHFNINFRRF